MTGKLKLSAAGVAVRGAVRFTHTAVSAAYTVKPKDHVLICDSSGGAFTVTLPAAAGAKGRTLFVKDNGSATANNVTIDGSGSETIDGAATYILNANNEGVLLFCDGTEWYVLAGMGE